MMREEPVSKGKPASYLVVGGAITVALLLGIGVGWMLADDAEAVADVVVPSAVETIQSEWFSAWNEADGETVVAMMVPGGHHYCPGTGSDGASGGELADFVAKGLAISDVENVGTVSMVTPGDASGASQDHIVVAELTVSGHPGYVSVLHLRGPEDGLRVVSHRSHP